MIFQSVLLIDDDLEDQEIFTSALEEVSSAVQCTTMSSAAEALSTLREATQKPEIIFLDLNMPIMNGQEFLKTIRQADDLADIPVIIFTTSSHPPTIAETRALGATDFMTKPGRFKDLVEILKEKIKRNGVTGERQK